MTHLGKTDEICLACVCVGGGGGGHCLFEGIVTLFRAVCPSICVNRLDVNLCTKATPISPNTFQGVMNITYFTNSDKKHLTSYNPY